MKKLISYPFLFYCFAKLFSKLHYVNKHHISMQSGFTFRTILLFSATTSINFIFIVNLLVSSFGSETSLFFFFFFIVFNVVYFYKVNPYDLLYENHKQIPENLVKKVGRVYVAITLILFLLWFFL